MGYPNDGVCCCFQDDLGAPLLQKKQLVGFYIGCYQQEPFVFTRVADFRGWILKTIKGNSVGDEAEGIDFWVEENEDDNGDDDDNSDDDDDDGNDDDSYSADVDNRKDK